MEAALQKGKNVGVSVKMLTQFDPGTELMQEAKGMLWTTKLTRLRSSVLRGAEPP